MNLILWVWGIAFFLNCVLFMAALLSEKASLGNCFRAVLCAVVLLPIAPIFFISIFLAQFFKDKE